MTIRKDGFSTLYADWIEKGDIENKIQLSDLHTIEKNISSQTAYLTKIETKKNKSKSLQPLYPI